jgi:hypothetical protein
VDDAGDGGDGFFHLNSKSRKKREREKPSEKRKKWGRFFLESRPLLLSPPSPLRKYLKPLGLLGDGMGDGRVTVCELLSPIRSEAKSVKNPEVLYFRLGTRVLSLAIFSIVRRKNPF